VDHDLHVHTFLSSCCADERATPENILAMAAETGLRTVGFADHMWDRRVPGASPWYRPQSYEHICQIREQIPADTGGVRVLVGCETEYCGGGRIGISPEVAEQLDFVLVATSHTHMGDFVVPPGCDSTQDIASLLADRFSEVVELGLATGVAHPFLPVGQKEQVDEIIALISDQRFLDCFGRAAERGVSVEVTVNSFPSIGGWEWPGFHDETFLRVLTLAKQAGCVFHFASDTHTVVFVGQSLALEPFARAAGITRDDVLPLVR